jgi:hypothetical protein
MKRLTAILLCLLSGVAYAAPFETSVPQVCTNLDHYNIHVGTTVTALAPTTNTSGQCYFHYDIGPLITGLSNSAANALLATYTVTAANVLNMESTSVPFVALPGVPSAPGALSVTAQ